MSLFDFSYAFPNTIEEVDQFSGKEFEVFLFNFLKVLGCEPRLTDDTNDKGIDLTIQFPHDRGNKKVGIQAKRWRSPVGSEEIRTMLDGKKHYFLDEVWIITTSKLTSSAITTAMNNSIEILTRDNVIGFLEELKKKTDVKFKPLKVVETKKPVVEKPVLPIETNERTNEELDESNDLVIKLKKLRIEIAKEQKISQLYIVYSNNTIQEIVNLLPKSLDELKGVKGLGEKKIQAFGKRIVEAVLLYSKAKIDSQIISQIKSVRARITSFNKITSENDAFNDQVLNEIVEKRVRSIEDLKKVNGFKSENITLFGTYLIKRLNEIFDGKFEKES